MKFEYGKEIPISVPELVDPKHSALLIIDVQNDYAKMNGRLLYPQLVKNLVRMVEAARRAGILVLYIQDTVLRDRLSDSPAWIRHYMLGESKRDPSEIGTGGLDGTKGQEIIDEIRPQQNEIIIKKFRSSAFVGTCLDLILRSNNIKSIVVTGLFTEGCVESTCRDASNEYFVVLAEDCVHSDRKELPVRGPAACAHHHIQRLRIPNRHRAPAARRVGKSHPWPVRCSTSMTSPRLMLTQSRPSR